MAVMVMDGGVCGGVGDGGGGRVAAVLDGGGGDVVVAAMAVAVS